MSEIFDGLGYHIYLGSIMISLTWLVITLINRVFDLYIYKNIKKD